MKYVHNFESWKLNENGSKKRIFGALARGASDRDVEGILNYLNVRHPEHKFGCTEKGDRCLYVEGDLDDETAKKLLADVASTGAHTVGVMKKYVE